MDSTVQSPTRQRFLSLVSTYKLRAGSRVAIVGSRDFPDLTLVCEFVEMLPPGTIVVSGHADGVDQTAEQAAKICQLAVLSFPVATSALPPFGTPGYRQAYAIAAKARNQQIVDAADIVVAFHHANSPGTRDTIAKGRRAGKPVIINPHVDDSPADESQRVARDLVLPIAQDMARTLEPACEQLYIAGSLRRGKAAVKDAELVALPKVINGQDALWWVLDRLLAEGAIEKALYGDSKTTRWGDKYRGFIYQSIKIEVFRAEAHTLGYQYWLRTGPGDANKYFMQIRQKKAAPFHVDKGQVLWGDTVLDIPDEATWFKLLGIPPIPAQQRSIAAYKRHFESRSHQWPHPKKFAKKARQLMLGGGFSMFNEGSLITYLEQQGKLKAEASKRDETPFEWVSPWLAANGMVWVHAGWQNGQRTYTLVAKDSDRARKQADILRGHFYYSETLPLQDWLNIQQGDVATPNYDARYNLEAIPRQYAHQPRNAELDKRLLSIYEVRPTQATVNYAHAMSYYRNLRIVDKNDLLPIGMKFLDTPVLLLNGHHRYAAKWWGGSDVFPVLVDAIPLTLAQALGEIASHNEDVKLDFFADVLAEAYDILLATRREAIYAN